MRVCGYPDPQHFFLPIKTTGETSVFVSNAIFYSFCLIHWLATSFFQFSKPFFLSLIMLISIHLLCVLLYPPEEGAVVLRMETDVGQDLSNQGQDPGIVGVGLQIVGQHSAQSWIRGLTKANLIPEPSVIGQ
jgi:hypothetical protein